MPKPALSLVAFHGQEKTFEYLQQMCILDDSSPQALQQHFNHANSQLGPAFVNAGCPEVIDLPTEYQPYCHAVLNSPPAKALEQFGSMTIRLIEIAPLLATQHHIELDRASSLYCSTGKVPDIAEMLPVCLPIGPQNISLEPSRPQTPLSWTLRTPSLNFRITGGGLFPLESGDIYFGAKLAVANPLVWVTQYDGKSQLNNGYHRSYSLGKAGAQYMPCLFQEVASLEGIENANFSRELLLTNNPPTVGHYVDGRAYPVTLRNYKKYMQITYAEHLFFED